MSGAAAESAEEKETESAGYEKTGGGLERRVGAGGREERRNRVDRRGGDGGDFLRELGRAKSVVVGSSGGKIEVVWRWWTGGKDKVGGGREAEKLPLLRLHHFAPPLPLLLQDISILVS